MSQEKKQSQPVSAQPDNKAGGQVPHFKPVSAGDFLHEGLNILEERGKIYDTKEKGERSMGKAVSAFAIITGKQLTEAEGWEFMAVLKQVRAFQRPTFHQDSWQDFVNYAALGAEAAAAADRVHRIDGDLQQKAKSYTIALQGSGDELLGSIRIPMTVIESRAWNLYFSRVVGSGINPASWSELSAGDKDYWLRTLKEIEERELRLDKPLPNL